MSDRTDDPEGPDAARRAEAALAALLGIPVEALRDPAQSGPALADALGDAGRWLRDAVFGDAEAREAADARWAKLRRRLADAGLDVEETPDDLAARLRRAVPTREAIERLRQGAQRSEAAAVELSTLGMRAGEWLKSGADRLRAWADRLAEAERTPRPRPDLRVVPGGGECSRGAPSDEAGGAENEAPSEAAGEAVDDPKAQAADTAEGAVSDAPDEQAAEHDERPPRDPEPDQGPI